MKIFSFVTLCVVAAILVCSVFVETEAQGRISCSAVSQLLTFCRGCPVHTFCARRNEPGNCYYECALSDFVM
uniref:Sperm protein n=1 Tax=Haliotis fulgens TaxID=6456 RepID=M9W7M8_HALFU|nr:sperm protein [Haliotis fulgens]